MARVTCGSAAVLDGRIALPLHGAWTARLRLDTTTEPTGSVSIVAENGLTLQGTIAGGGVRLGSAHVLVTGGARGLGTMVSGAWRQAKLRDPLNAIARASGEELSTAIASDLLGTALPEWTINEKRAAAALDELAAFASVGWRILADGTLWMGAETWPTATLPEDAPILDAWPDERRTVIAPATPALLPGVDLENVGRVVEVVHWIEPEEIRTWAMV